MAQLASSRERARRGGDRPPDQRLEPVLCRQHVERRARRAARARHVAPQLRRDFVRPAGEFARAGNGSARETQRQRGGQARGFGRFAERFDQQEDISGAAARDRSHRVEQGLVLDPGAVAGRGEQPVAQAALVRGHPLIGAGDGDAAPDRRRRVGHRADDGGGAEMAGHAGNRLAGDNRQKQRGRRRPAAIVG